jgi:hypothetical protein
MPMFGKVIWQGGLAKEKERKKERDGEKRGGCLAFMLAPTEYNERERERGAKLSTSDNNLRQ